MVLHIESVSCCDSRVCVLSPGIRVLDQWEQAGFSTVGDVGREANFRCACGCGFITPLPFALLPPPREGGMVRRGLKAQLRVGVTLVT